MILIITTPNTETAMASDSMKTSPNLFVSSQFTRNLTTKKIKNNNTTTKYLYNQQSLLAYVVNTILALPLDTIKSIIILQLDKSYNLRPDSQSLQTALKRQTNYLLHLSPKLLIYLTYLIPIHIFFFLISKLILHL